MSDIQTTQNPQPSSPPAPELTKSLTPEAKAVTQQFGWDFFKAGVLIVDEWQPRIGDNDPEILYLLMREAKVKQKQPDGTKKWVLSDEGKWNLPCGRLKIGESFDEAAFREGEEETGYSLYSRNFDDSRELCHIGFRADADNPYTILIFTATTKQFLQRPDPEEVAETRWFNYDQILDLLEKNQLRNPKLLMGAVENYRNNDLHPATFLTTYPPREAKPPSAPISDQDSPA